MWFDYGIYVSTGLVLIAGLTLIVMMIRNRGGRGARLVLIALLLIGLAATPLLRPELLRERGEVLIVTESPRPTTHVEMIGTCLSVFRKIGPLSFVMGTALLPDESWDRGPYNGCDASAFSGVINLPVTVRSGRWMLCDYATCHELAPA